MSSIGDPPDTPRGIHLLVEYVGCDAEVLTDLMAIEGIMLEAARRASVTVLTRMFHKFGSDGVTGVVVVAESHLSIHTWPEHAYAALDFFTCGVCSPEVAEAFVRVALGAQYVQHVAISRGCGIGVGPIRSEGVSIVAP
jgi:S-adenosylmethionine decarboxylase proenzyme